MVEGFEMAMFVFRCFELYFTHRMVKLICSVHKVAPHTHNAKVLSADQGVVNYEFTEDDKDFCKGEIIAKLG